MLEREGIASRQGQLQREQRQPRSELRVSQNSVIDDWSLNKVFAHNTPTWLPGFTHKTELVVVAV